MKRSITLFLFLISQFICVNAQSGKIKHPALIIDDIKITSWIYLNYIDPVDIESIRIIQKNNQLPDGGMAVTLKDKGHLTNLLNSKLLSLKEIAKKKLPNSGNQQTIVYVLNGQMLKDTTGILIPLTCLTNVTVLKATEAPYYKTLSPGALVMMIATNPKWTPPDLSQKTIKGSPVNTMTSKKSN